tara:strand:+ start:154 stop:327 length:174 start_codon:yes stop_codon:yes gene_type:complete
MENFTKKDLLLILNVYQNYINDFVNISDEDLNKIYFEIAKKDMKNLLTKNKENEYNK